MTRAYSPAFKRRMVARLIGSDAVSALQLSRETGIRQQNLSRWLEEARSLPCMTRHTPVLGRWTARQKARLLADAGEFERDRLAAYLEAKGVVLAEFEQWRVALEGDPSRATANPRCARRRAVFWCTISASLPSRRDLRPHRGTFAGEP